MTMVPGGLFNSSFVVIMNEERYNKLSRADREAIDSVSGEVVSRRVGRGFEAQEKNSLAALQSAKVAVTSASPQFIEALKARTAHLETEWVRQAGAKGIDGARALAEFRAEIRKVSR